MSDNGILNGEHSMVDKRTAHEPSIRIVQLVRYPGLTPPNWPKIIDAQVLTVDIAPSLLKLRGAPPLDGIHGRFGVRLVREGDPAWRTSWLYTYNYERQFPHTPNVRCVRGERWKYIRYPHGDGGPDRYIAELYDFREDPEERHNLAGDAAHAVTLERMRAELLRAMAEVGLSPETDVMPPAEGIKPELPDAKIR